MIKRYILGLMLLLIIPYVYGNSMINNSWINNSNINITIEVTDPLYYGTLTNETGYIYIANATPENLSIDLTFNITHEDRRYQLTTNNTATLERMFFYATDNNSDMIRYQYNTGNNRVDIFCSNLSSIQVRGLNPIRGAYGYYEVWKDGDLFAQNQDGDSFTLTSCATWSLFPSTTVYSGALGSTERLLIMVLLVLIFVGVMGLIEKNPAMMVAGIVGLVMAVIMVGSIL